MNMREAKREACAFVSILIKTIDNDAFENEYTQENANKILAAIKELSHELSRRGTQQNQKDKNHK